MAEETKPATPPTTEAAATDKAAEPAAEKPVEPSLADDILRLEQIDRLRAVVLRMQGGQHPNKVIDALLRRRLNIPREEFQGHYAIRLICTLMMVFVASTLVWAILWAIGSAMELSYVVNLISTGMATLFAAIAGVAVFHPASVPDEKKLIDAIEARMNELRLELGKGKSAGNTAAETDKASNDVDKKSSTTTEEGLKAASDQDTENSTPAPDAAVATDEGSADVSP